MIDVNYMLGYQLIRKCTLSYSAGTSVASAMRKLASIALNEHTTMEGIYTYIICHAIMDIPR